MTENKVLIIDDDMEFIQLIAEILDSKGYKVGFSLSAEDALKVLDAVDYDLIILDLNMPRINGFDVIEELKSNKRHKLIPILMSTADARKKSVLKAIQLGADDYIIKPVDEELFLEKIGFLFKIRNFVKRWGVLAK